MDLNQGEIFANGFLDAFNVTRTGGNAPLFDKLFAGLTVPGQGAVDGVTVRGSDYARVELDLRHLPGERPRGDLRQQSEQLAS